MSLLIDAVSWLCLVAGGFFCVVGAIGLLRMPDCYSRLHAASVTDTLGAGLILLGLILQAGFTLVAAKLLMIGLLFFFTSPATAHALAKAAMMRGVLPKLADDPASPATPLPTAAAGSAHLESVPSKP
ncbi:MAG TPA: monovalent cation/H(+) antiporter subunit G [Candidatus Accumulibacter phosphatis]|nr:MAG: Multiple resistance and pH homeostasis protein G [Candidatus Accumulibacter sp. SK-11]HRL75630.1 monovalent cation/H(+) antiporter subunit G [Candidatus Accumulibacter phosphatis]HRQ94590.1 monovalent cation/H(+) antiporter subunit G [Candidatus Accumulibacter phosphatis]